MIAKRLFLSSVATCGLALAAAVSFGAVTSTAEACHICVNTGTTQAECRYTRDRRAYSECTVRTQFGSTTCSNGGNC